MTTDFIPPDPATLTLEEHTQKALHVLGQIIGGVAMKGSLAEDGARAAQDVVARLLAHHQQETRQVVVEALSTLEGVAFSGDYAIGDDAIGTLEALMEDLKSGALMGTVDVEARFVPHQLSDRHRDRAIDLLWPRLSPAEREAKANLLDEVYPALVQGAPYDGLTLALQRRFEEEQLASEEREELSADQMEARRREAVVQAFLNYTPDSDLAGFQDVLNEVLGLGNRRDHRYLLVGAFEALDPDVQDEVIRWGFQDTAARDRLAEGIDAKRTELLDHLGDLEDTVQLD